MANLRANNLTGTGGRNAIDGSVFFDGESSYLTMPDSEDFNIGSSDFTIELWMYKNDTSTYQHIFRQRDSGSAEMAIVLDIDSTGSDSFASGYFQMEWGANKRFVGVNAGLTNNTWHHLALTKEGTTGRVFVNGVLVGTDTLEDIGNYSDDFYVGYWVGGLGYYFKGYISNFRICKGQAIYTANFAPPTQKLDLHAESVLLCCQDSDDPTQEATGKTITGYGNYYGNTTTNLITNGDFGTGDLTGWTTDQATTSVVSGSARIVPNSGVNGALFQQFTTVAGKQYKATMRVTNTPTSNFARLHLGTGTDIDSANKYLYSNGTAAQNVGQGTYSFVFTPTGTTTTLWLEVGGGTQVTTDFDDISVVGHNVGPAPKFLPPVGIDDGTVLDGGVGYDSLNYLTLPKGNTTQSNRGRGLHNTGYSGGEYNSIVYVNIQSMGNSIDFGDMTENVYANVGGGNGTRGIFAGGYSGNNSPDTDLNIIDFVTIASTGNATTFGDTNNNIRYPSAVSNSTRMLICGGGAPRINNIDYITIATTGDAADWGDLIGSDNGKRGSFCNSVMSPTRGIVCGGNDSTGTKVRNMTYMTIATLGSAADFGDLSTDSSGSSGGNCSSNTRGVIQLGMTSPNRVNTLEYVTIASTGNAQDFGDLTQAKNATSPCSNSTRGVFFGGGLTPNGPTTNTIDAVTIATTGNAYDFGDIVQVWGDSNNGTQLGAATSDSHGGLGQ